MRKILAGSVLAALLAIGLIPAGTHLAAARESFPPHLDPKSWEVPEDMVWGDYKRIPDGNYDEVDNPRKIRVALILGDFKDQKFRVAETTKDPTGQRGLGVNNPGKFWLDYLFNNEKPSFYNKGHTVTEYWLEDSYGLIEVESEYFGPYHLEGNMYEYGATDFGTGADCPDGPDGCDRDFDTELLEASTVDVATSVQEKGAFDFRFLLHSGYDESGTWLNYGLAKFKNREAVTDKFGPKNPSHRNWGTTRYVPWSSFFSTQQIWSHALPGLLSTQGESDGGSTYAHELSHIFGILDNYNNPYAENPKRAYSGPWDMMSRGTFNGPGGPFERWRIPPTEGGTMGSQHMIRNKLRLGFIPPTEVTTLTKDALDTAGVVKARILQRESPPATADPNLVSGIRITLGEDQQDCDNSKPKCDGGNYDFFDVEVVNRQGFDSFLPDHGVIAAKTKTADASPFIWVIDAHPKDLKKTDYVAADGTRVPYTVGDYRQLADAAFHAGTAPKTRNRYTDKKNGIALYVLRKRMIEGRLMYVVAVGSRNPTVPPGEATVKKVKGSLVPGRIRRLVFKVTNDGQRATVFKLGLQKSGGVKTRLLNDLKYLDPGQTKRISVWAKASSGPTSLKLTARGL
jgi:M6 family metalloprotease-like protein